LLLLLLRGWRWVEERRRKTTRRRETKEREFPRESLLRLVRVRKMKRLMMVVRYRL